MGYSDTTNHYGAQAHPPVTQSITAAGNTIKPTGRIIEISADGVYSLSSTPMVSDGNAGQVITIINTGSNAVTLSDQGTVANSGLRLGNTTRALGQRDNITLLYSSTLGDWIEIGFVNVT